MPVINGPTNAISTAVANTLIQRDANARAQVADPSAAQDIATKNYVDASAGRLYGENENTTTLLMAAASTNYIVPSVSVTFTLTVQRRVRIVCAARMDAASGATSAMQFQCAYVAGSSATLTGATLLGNASMGSTNVASGLFARMREEHTVLLAAGTYTAFGVASRVNGGASDVLRGGYCAVYDAGPS